MKNKFSRSLLALSLASAGWSAQAATVEASIAYDTMDRHNTSWLVPAQHGQTSNSVAQVSVNDFAPIGNAGHWTYMQGVSRINSDGSLGTDMSLSAGGQLKTQLRWSQSFSNDSGEAQNYAMQFNIAPVHLSMGGWSANHEQRDFRAGFDVQILLNGSLVWNTGLSLGLIGNEEVLTRTGAFLGEGTLQSRADIHDEMFFNLGAYLGQVDLGQFGAGNSFTIEYVLNAALDWSDPYGCAYECGGIVLNLGDPFNFNAGIQVQGQPAGQAVPEPGTLVLLASGLLGLGLSRRKQAAKIS